MSIMRLLVIIGAVAFAVHWWNGRNEAAEMQALISPNGFVPAVMPDGATRNTVVILAPVNCPSEAAQRADALAMELSSRGIRNVRSSNYNVQISEPTKAENAGIKRAVSVLNGEIPAVFVNGMAKSNPTASEVASEYARTNAAADHL